METVGVGQGEIDVVDHADTIVLALMPGSGDSIQALKAGVMEIPDVIVVNKCRPPSRRHDGARGQAVLALGPERSWRVPVVKTEAAKGEGIAELARRSTPTASHIEQEGTLEERRARNLRAEVIGIAASRMRRDLEAGAGDDPECAELLDSVVGRETDPATAARKLLENGRWPMSGRGQTPSPRPRRARLAGHRLDEIGGVGVGKVEGAYVDAEERRAEWLFAMGRFGHHTLVPARDAVAGVGHVWVPYARRPIRRAPQIEPKRADARARAGAAQLYGTAGSPAGRRDRGAATTGATRVAAGVPSSVVLVRRLATSRTDAVPRRPGESERRPCRDARTSCTTFDL